MIIESRLVEELTKKLDEEDARAVEAMSSGVLKDYGEYREQHGRRRALAAAKVLLTETFEDLMKE